MDATVAQLLTADHPTVDLNPSQEQLVDFLNQARNQSWDLPSAFLAICDHPNVFDPKDFPNFDTVPMHRDPQPYWDGLNPWPLIDRHFADIHNLDLTDPNINWDFDT